MGENGWTMSIVQIHIGDRLGKNPAPGQFDFQSSEITNSGTKFVASIDSPVECGNSVYIAVHADVHGSSSETAWARGNETFGEEGENTKWGWQQSYDICCNTCEGCTSD